MSDKIKNLKLVLQVLFTSAETVIPANVLRSHIDDKRLVDQLYHLTSNTSTYVSDDSFVDLESLETVRDSLYDTCAVLADSGKHPILHAQICALIREVNMARTVMRDPSMGWWNDYLRSCMRNERPIGKRLSEILPPTATT